MNAKKIVFCLMILGVLVTSCSPAAPTQNPIATSKGDEVYELPVVEAPRSQEPKAGDSVVEGEPARIDNSGSAESIAPFPTSAPTFSLENPEEYYEEQPITPYDNRFDDYGVNPFVRAEIDHYSTFALDVDTASYSVMRRYIQDGNLPPYESVRVEEYLNYFDPGYAAPQNGGLAIYADGAPNPFSPNRTYLLRFGIQGYEVSDEDRKPANLTFVIDISGSMDMENRLGLVKRSLNMLVQQLHEDDQVSIVVFGSKARVALEPTFASKQNAILSEIRGLNTEGATNAEAGLKLGYRNALAMYDPEMINRVILCSDGVANVGETGPDGILEQVSGYVKEGISLVTIGFGMGNFNDTLMEQLADNGDGFYAYVDTLDEAQNLFVDKITSTLQTIARDAKIQVDFNPEVVNEYRLVGYENRDVADEDFRDDSVDAGELGAGHHAVALYEVVLNREVEGRIATVQLRWENPDTYEVQEINGNYNTWDLFSNFEDTNHRYQLAVLVMQYAEVLRESPWAWDVDMDDLRIRSRQLAQDLSEDVDVREFAELVDQAEYLMNDRW
ncbi:MAG: VWA domain-containing protein [Chloroflexi bacterium HGW-Chloroflexi-10]|nr:MAG: VWA domain-containing protein [Chloroflexi bacterium HGW-Chloroflexi-10]